MTTRIPRIFRMRSIPVLALVLVTSVACDDILEPEAVTPPPLMDGTLFVSGPSTATPHSRVTVVANMAGAWGRVSYRWQIDGAPACMSVIRNNECSAVMGEPGVSTHFWVEAIFEDGNRATANYVVMSQ
jgi:hypothetical protein